MTESRPINRKISRRRFRFGRSAGRGFTLAEVMIAVTIFAMLSLGIYQMLIKAYQLSAITRYRDDARAVLLSFADQFTRLQTTTTVSGTAYTRYLFAISSSPTGKGLRWGSLSDQDASTAIADASYLSVTIGGSSVGLPAKVTRTVVPLNASTGASASSTTYTAAGYMMLGTFTITYDVFGRTYNQSISVIRSAP